MAKSAEITNEATSKPTGKPTGEFKTVIDFPETDPKTGKPVAVRKTPEEAVKRMKELPEYGNLFVSGTPQKSAMPKKQDQVDVRNLTPAEYREIRKTNPELLGLRPRRC